MPDRSAALTGME